MLSSFKIFNGLIEMFFYANFSHNLNFNSGNNGSIGEQFTEIYIKKDSNVQLIIDLLVINRSEIHSSNLFSLILLNTCVITLSFAFSFFSFK